MAMKSTPKLYFAPHRVHVTKWTIPRVGGPRYFEVHAGERVLVVEDSLSRVRIFHNWLGSAGRIVRRANSAILAIQKQQFDWVFLDRDLGVGAGYGEDVAAELSRIRFSGRVVVHSTNPFGAQLISNILADAEINVESVPFGFFGIFRS
jgi:hypothetical protein